MKKNKNLNVLLLFLLILFACEDGDKAIETITEEVERGAVLRTISIENTTLDINRLDQSFSVLLEEQDLEEGDLLENVSVFVRFEDNTLANGDSSTQTFLLENLESDAWDRSGILPRNTLTYNLQELLNTTGLTINDISVKDQFILNLSLQLNDSREFDETNASSIILAFDTFFSSPFTYTITLVEPIAEDQFTGIYTIESILDGPNGPTFVDEFLQPLENGSLIEITASANSDNVREFRAYHNLHHVGLEQPRRWQFTVADDVIFMGKHQLSSPEGWCIRNAAPLLLGPDEENGIASTQDDTVFELWFVEGYLGFDGSCNFGTEPSRYRFSKQ